MLRRLTLSLLALILLALAGYAALVLVNHFDEPLSEEAQAFIASARLEVPADQNAYFAVLGWRAADGLDAHRAGLEAFERWRRASAAERASLHMPLDIPMPAERDLCTRRSLDCLVEVAAAPARYRASLQHREILLERLASLSRYPRFYAPLVLGQDPDEPVLLPPHHELMKLGATASAVDWVTGEHEQALGSIASRAAVARRALRDASSALALALAEMWLRSEIALAAEAMADDPHAAARHAPVLAGIFAPLRADELHSSQWLRGEFALVSGMFLAIGSSRNTQVWVIGEALQPGLFNEMIVNGGQPPMLASVVLTVVTPLFQPHATLNLLYHEFAYTGMAAAQAPAARIAMGDEQERSPGTTWVSLRNPMGRFYMASGNRRGPWASIAERHDLDRFIRLCRVQLELLRHGVRHDAVPAFLASSALAVDPATGKSMGWDAGQSRLWVEAMSEKWANGSRHVGSVPGNISLHYRPRDARPRHAGKGKA